METLKNKRIIFVPYADKVGGKTSFNLKKAGRRKETYLKNCCVALVSAKYYNPDCDVALVTNADVPDEYQRVLDAGGVKIMPVPFEEFTFDSESAWVFDFYKLCALLAVSQYGYDAYCYFDSDVYIQGDFSGIWEECKENILMYDINHGLKDDNYRHLLSEMETLLGHPVLLTQYGGEFFAADHTHTVVFLEECRKVWQEMQRQGFLTIHGNEFLASVAVSHIRAQVKNAGGYVCRFWTGSFRLVSNCYQYDSVVALHVPAEKEAGMLKLYDAFIRRGRVPSRRTMWRILHLRRRSCIEFCKFIVKKILGRM